MARRKVSDVTTAYESLPVAGAAESLPRPGFIVVGAQRRIVLPPDVAEHLGVKPGDRLVYFFDQGNTIRLQSGRTVARSAVGILRHLVPPGRSVVDELIADRREEARREERGEA